ncbi:MAG: PTS sugar transporter subunit IIA [Spirochaetes bacterium]|nr:PTS sugar transporter subunit IIA [Spirochaetota bacterium]
MHLTNVLTRDSIALHLKGATKAAIISEMVDLFHATGRIPDKAKALAGVFERERMISTGMKHGIAIPHGKTPSVREMIAFVGISDNPVDFDALDGEPCRIFILTLSPPDRNGPHLQFLAEISILFKSTEKRAALLAAKTPEEVIGILSE